MDKEENKIRIVTSLTLIGNGCYLVQQHIGTAHNEDPKAFSVSKSHLQKVFLMMSSRLENQQISILPNCKMVESISYQIFKDEPACDRSIVGGKDAVAHVGIL